MKKKLQAFSLTAFLLLSFFISNSQPPTDRYYTVVLKGNVVTETLSSYPDFSYFDFTYQQLNNGYYSLVAQAKDENGSELGNLIKLTPMLSQPARRFNNLENGHLFLTLAIMQSHNVDGSEDYVLTPRKCKDHSGEYVDYVSYRFSNKPEESFGFIQAKSVTAVKTFDLNPSPPY